MACLFFQVWCKEYSTNANLSSRDHPQKQAGRARTTLCKEADLDESGGTA